MKNISVSLKMIICFSLMILMTLSISVAGIIGMTELNAQTTAMYEEIVVAMDYIALIRENFQEQRVLIQELLLVSTDPSKVSLDITEKSEASRVIGMINTNKTEMNEYLDAYDHTILQRKNLVNKELASAENAATFLRYSQLYRDYFEPELTRISRAYTTIGNEEIEAFIRSDESVEMAELINQGYAFYSELSRENIQESSELYTLLRAIIVIDTVITLAVSAFFAIYLPITIARPLRHMVLVADAVSEGNMDMEVGHQNRRDEVGRLAQAFGRMQTEIKGQIGVVESLAHADLTVEPTPRGAHDTLGNALVRLTDSLDQIITDVTIASDSVAVESRDVAGQSQELAQGTTEQAASVEELSSAFLEISMNTKDSATLAGKAASLTDNVRKMAMEGESLMAQLAQAVQETDTAGKNIDKIIRAIEEISFQTNILALNAAVEAAHAGQNGSGFAVVAAEVRSLASKSAASSKETSELIADTLDKIQFGAELAAKTSASFKQIVEGIMESTRLVTNIAKSSEEQAIAIDQINTGISQVAQVIHINSSAAERCASAAERMSMQARRLERSIGKFKTKAAPAGVPPTREAPEIVLEPAPPRPAAPDHIDLSPSIPTDDFGKY